MDVNEALLDEPIFYRYPDELFAINRPLLEQGNFRVQRQILIKGIKQKLRNLVILILVYYWFFRTPIMGISASFLTQIIWVLSCILCEIFANIFWVAAGI